MFQVLLFGFYVLNNLNTTSLIEVSSNTTKGQTKQKELKVALSNEKKGAYVQGQDKSRTTLLRCQRLQCCQSLTVLPVACSVACCLQCYQSLTVSPVACNVAGLCSVASRLQCCQLLTVLPAAYSVASRLQYQQWLAMLPVFAVLPVN